VHVLAPVLYPLSIEAHPFFKEGWAFAGAKFKDVSLCSEFEGMNIRVVDESFAPIH
jgi:hypothetical protein